MHASCLIYTFHLSLTRLQRLCFVALSLSIGAEDEELTLAYRDGLVEELFELFERFAEAHRKVSGAGSHAHALAA